MTRRKNKKKSGDCTKCGTYRLSLHRDHVVPRCKGGLDDDRNIQWICANCHEDKTREDFKGFNLTPNRKPVSDETRQKIGDAHRGLKHSPEHIEKRASKLRGRTHEGHPHTEETKAKISATQKGRPGRKGVMFSDEHKNKISSALKGKQKSLEHVAASATAKHGKLYTVSDILDIRNAKQEKLREAIARKESDLTLLKEVLNATP